MINNSLSMVLLVVVTVGLASHVINKYYRKKRKQIRCEVNEVIMFSYGHNKIIKKSKYSRCIITLSMDRLLYYLNSPRYSIDICMYVMTNADICNVIIKLHLKNVKIRIILDADMAFSSGSQLKRFNKQGIPVRWMKSTCLMHHKFCLIDTLDNNSDYVPIVMLGSLNWTNQGFCGNWEDVVVTSQANIVQGYKTEYERLWEEFRPLTDLV